ncbi:hypothetical protein GCM10019016_096860 [Streptomyces prasinosporus]|uniref:BetI-type transcriptional repressor C-terminal domain-containing protein n=1 Tax=Streptomyces prasinosporus TaxID=68256 RepID=A0ABP6U4W1_9ACTN|nr:hypothetical protein GCM10010332_55460 [Streptomyces albogriseolus]
MPTATRSRPAASRDSSPGSTGGSVKTGPSSSGKASRNSAQERREGRVAAPQLRTAAAWSAAPDAVREARTLLALTDGLTSHVLIGHLTPKEAEDVLHAHLSGLWERLGVTAPGQTG